MKNITVREAAKSDIAGFVHIHRNCEDPWNNEEECGAWISKRLERGFYIQAASYDGKIVGHGEWIISEEPREKYLYLGMLQVDSEYQRRGIGREMIADGIRYAKAHGCSLIKTIPDTDTASELFYQKCGFVRGKKIKRCTVAVDGYENREIEGFLTDTVPYSVIGEKLFLFGLSQSSSRHIWECTNAKPYTDDRIAISALVGNAWLQISYFSPDDTGYVMCWASEAERSEEYQTTLQYALRLGNYAGLKHLNFVFYEEYSYLFDGYPIEDDNFEMYLPV